MNTIAQAKQAIKKTTQQLREEPLEMLKAAARQVADFENTNPQNEEPRHSENGTSQNKESEQQESEYKQKLAERDGRQLQALESELKDIRRQKLFNSLMQRIQSGENVSLLEFTELSYEQRDVLKAQIEAVKHRNNQPQIEPLQIPNAKRGRKMMSGQQQSAQKQTTRVEKPVPPSG